ncbi:MAG: cell division protein FtsL [Candidatus Aminicenantes bacterium]|jgi:cell division protein FtsL|nr:cell division protein FtsL [Candidatus Aminicenantes bacterium]TET70658.1 MAG: cell division protein FtsL [Candidatus Aminicenantes bacterium]
MVRKKYTTKEIMLFVSCTIIVIFILTFYIWHQMESIRIGYEIGTLEEKVLTLRRQVDELQTEKSYLLSLDRVEKIAKEELNLIEPKKEQLVYDEFIP